MRDPLNMRHEDVTFSVEEAYSVHRVWELDLSQETLVQVPNPHHSAQI